MDSLEPDLDGVVGRLSVGWLNYCCDDAGAFKALHELDLFLAINRRIIDDDEESVRCDDEDEDETTADSDSKEVILNRKNRAKTLISEETGRQSPSCLLLPHLRRRGCLRRGRPSASEF